MEECKDTQVPPVYSLIDALPSVYAIERENGVFIYRTIQDNENILHRDIFRYKTLADAINSFNEMYKMDKFIFEAFEGKTAFGTLLFEHVNNKYYYTFRIYNRDNSIYRSLVVCINDISKYMGEVFQMPKSEVVTQQGE